MSISPVSHQYSNFSFENDPPQVAAEAAIQHNNPLSSQNIAQYLTPFETVALFNTQAANEADIFLIGETHYDPESLRMQKDLIQFLASQGPVIVFVEGVESGMLLETKQTSVSVNLGGQRYFSAEALSTPLTRQLDRDQQNISLMGWDVSKGISRGAGYSRNRLNEIYKMTVDHTDAIVPLFKKIMHDSPDVGIILRDVMDALSPEEWVRKVNQAPNAIITETSDRIAKLFGAQVFAPTGRFLFPDILRLVFLFHAAEQHEVEAQEGEKHPVTPESIDKTFPLRTASMVSSLQQLNGIKLYTGDKNVKVVFIAGALHLITPIHQQNNPNVNLSSLYDELDYGEHRAAILIPPHVLASLVPRLGQDEEKE